MRWLLAVALAVVAFPVPLLAQSSEDDGCPTGPWIDVPGQGPSCRIEGGWEVRLRDDAVLQTHGPDPVPEQDVGAFSHSAAPICVADATTQYHNVLVYARASNRPDNSAAKASTLRGLVAQANGKLQHEALELGAQANFKFRCLGAQVEVVVATLATPYSAASFSTIVSDLQAQGFTSTLAKHWIWYDGQVPGCGGCGGQGNIWSDTRLDPANRHDSGPDYAITYGYDNWDIMMHESGHNLGAVQLSSPNSSGYNTKTRNGYHCNDGQDIMCYADGGSSSNYDPNVCATQHFDCNHDDYFHPSPATGNYLYAAWNLGSPIDRFIDWGATACVVIRTGNLLAPAPLGVGFEGLSQRTELNVPPSCENRRFQLRGGLSVGVLTGGVTSNFDV